jgi:DNA-binding beta-propeller fold protein YncE
MSLIARKVVDSDSVYNFLENSFFEVYNTLLSSESLVKFTGAGSTHFTLFRSQADFDGSLQVSTYAEDDEAQKMNFGILRFIGGEVDSNRLMNVYVQRYAVELLSFEEFRADIRTILTTFASSINGDTFQLSDDSGTKFTIFVNTQSFPDMSETIDANGVEKFLSSLVVEFLFYQDIVHSRDVVMKVEGVQIPYTEFAFTRQMVDPAVDLRKTFENKFIPTKSSSGVNITGYYQINEASSKIFDFILKDSALETIVRLYYNDGYKVKTGNYLISEGRASLPYNGVTSYSLGLIPAMPSEYPQAYFGALIQNGDGSNEYLQGSEVTVTFQKPIATVPAAATLLATRLINTNTPIPTDMFFKPDGSTVYFMNDGNAAENKVTSYSLSTPWTISTATYVSQVSLNAQALQFNDLFFKSDGTKMYALAADNDRMYQYTLSTPWDITTATYDNKSVLLSAKETNAQSVFFNSDGSSFFIIGTTNKKIMRWNMSVSWDVSTATFFQESSAFSALASPRGMYFSQDGTKLYLADSTTIDRLFYYVLPVGFNLLDIRLHSVLNVTGSPEGVFIKPDGTSIYYVDSVTANTKQYTMALPYVLVPTSRDLLSFEFEGIGFFDLVFESSTLLDLNGNGTNDTEEFEYTFTMPSNDVRMKILP